MCKGSSKTVAILWLVLAGGAVAAQSVQIKGIINGRTGATMTVTGQDSGNVVVVLTPATQVEEPEGLFRKKHVDVTALIPGLPVQVQGTYNAQNQLVAQTVKFNGSDLKAALDIQAGITPTQQQVQANQEQIKQSEQQIKAEKLSLLQQQQQIAAARRRIAANQAAIAADNKRFGELADYNIMGEATVYFANGSVTVESQYQSQLLQLAQQAVGITGYVIQVQGYASAVGSAALNQKLSTERADNVTQFLEQQGNVPLTNILAPGAMGTSDQVASDATTEGQAKNRRVVVRILQNKGIAGS
jgi:outer membrane protein OmpA-like peptidoglycan-associated protein